MSRPNVTEANEANEANEPNEARRAQTRLGRGRIISMAVFLVGALAFLGADSYKDFYYEMQAKVSGSSIDYQSLAEFCGWTGQALPGESQTERGLRAFWNMLSAMLGMTAISLVVFGLLFGIIFGAFYLGGAFK